MKMNAKATRAMITANGTPTPIPIFAPVEILLAGASGDVWAGELDVELGLLTDEV